MTVNFLKCYKRSYQSKYNSILTFNRLVKIHFENDLSNADATHPKVLSLNELMGHLISRVLNSRGIVKIPVGSLLSIFNEDCYANAQNQFLKRQTTEQIYIFVNTALDYSIENIEGVEFLKNTIASLSGSLPILEKVRLFVMLIYYLTRIGQMQPLDEIFKANESLKPIFLQFASLFTIALISCPYNKWQIALKPIFLGQIQSYRKNDSKFTEVQHNQMFENMILTMILQN